MDYSDNTRKNYRHWCKRLFAHTGKTSIKHHTQADLDRFFAWMVRDMGYPRSTVNQAKSAIKRLAEANGLTFDIKLVSARTDNYRPELLSETEAVAIIDGLDPPYRDIAERVFYKCHPPGPACAATASVLAGTLAADNATVHKATLNRKLQGAAKSASILKPVSGKTLQQSGIVCAWRRGVDRDELLQEAQITRQTLARYQRWA